MRLIGLSVVVFCCVIAIGSTPSACAEDAEARLGVMSSGQGKDFDAGIDLLVKDKSITSGTLTDYVKKHEGDFRAVLAEMVLARRNQPDEYEKMRKEALKFYDSQADKIKAPSGLGAVGVTRYVRRLPKAQVEGKEPGDDLLPGKISDMAPMRDSDFAAALDCLPLDAVAIDSNLGELASLEVLFSLKRTDEEQPLPSDGLVDVSGTRYQSSCGITDRMTVGALCKFLSSRQLMPNRVSMVLHVAKTIRIPSECILLLVKTLGRNKAKEAVAWIAEQKDLCRDLAKGRILAEALADIGSEEALKVLHAWKDSDVVYLQDSANFGLEKAVNRSKSKGDKSD